MNIQLDGNGSLSHCGSTTEKASKQCHVSIQLHLTVSKWQMITMFNRKLLEKQGNRSGLLLMRYT